MSELIDLKNVTKFNGENFQAWKFQMRAIFVANDILSIVTGIETAPIEEEAERKAWIKKDAKAMFILSSSMDPGQLEHLITCKSSAEMWKKLSALHEQRSESNKLILLTRFHDYRMSSNDSVAQHVAKVENMARQLIDLDENISDITIMAKILGSLPSKYNAFVTAWDSVDTDKQNLENLTTRLLKEESRMTAMDDVASALSAVNVSKPQKSSDKNIHPKRFVDKRKDVECNYCHKKGHVIKYCRKRLRSQNTPGQKAEGQTENYGAFSAETDIVEINPQDTWTLDSGASRHMSFHRQWFHDFQESNGDSVTIGDGTVCEVKGHGTIFIKRKIGDQWLDGRLDNVLYIPSLNKNLFSVGACTKKGHEVVFKATSVIISQNKKPMAIAVSHGINLYRMLIKTCCRAEANVAASSKLRLWHERLGHVGLKSLVEMNKKGLLDLGQVSQETELFCGPCQVGKQHRRPFQSITARNTQPGELIHTDVGGPMQNESIGGSRFYVIFKDDASSFTSIYFIRHKADVFEKFKEYQALITNKFSRPIKAIRMDNGKEYINHSMKSFLTSRGIQIEATAPYTPQQNGCSERHNRTLVEKARTMLHAKNLTLRLWAEAMNTAVYIYNRTPLSHKNGLTPYEIWTGKQVNLTHMKTFGCEAYVHIPSQQRRKWDPKSKRMIFIGYQGESSNYRLYDPETCKIKISRDVTFNEKAENNDVPDENEMILPLSISNAKEKDDNQYVQRENVTDAGLKPSEDADGIKTPSQPQRNLRDRSKLKKPQIYEANFIEFIEPLTYEDAISGPDADKWKEAIEEELAAHDKNQTWRMEPLPQNRTTVKCKWVFKVKNSSNSSPRYKARLCAKGFTQRAGIDYDEVFSPVVRYESIRTLLAIAAEHDLEMAQFDVKTAFLNSELKEEIYMDVPKGVISKDKNHVCRLLRSLYGLKQASREWNVKFDSFLRKFNFIPSSADPCVYRGFVNNIFVFLGLYVDDGMVFAETEEALNEVINVLRSAFDITTCNLNTFVGIQIERDKENHSIFIHQKNYIERILARFNMSEAKHVSVPIDPHSIANIMNDKGNGYNDYPYRAAIGSLIFLSQLTRPDIIFAVNILSRYLTCHTEVHWRAVKHVFRYLAGTADLGICYRKTDVNPDLLAYSDADYAGDLVTRRSTTGYIFLLSNGPISWCSQRQKIVSLSTTEAEYVAASMASRELIWLRRLLSEVCNPCDKATELRIDNQSAIKLVKNPEFHKKTKHIDIHCHFIREQLVKGDLCVNYVRSEDQYADFLTKALAKEKFNRSLNAIGMFKYRVHFKYRV